MNDLSDDDREEINRGDYLAEAEFDAQYEFFEGHFKAEAAEALVRGVSATHHLIAPDVNLALQWARDAFYRGRIRDGLGRYDVDALLVSYLRSYRTVDWYLSETTRSIVLALVEPYSRFVDNPQPHVFLGRTAVEIMQKRVFREAFPGANLIEAIRQYQGSQRMIRNEIVHGNRIPTIAEAQRALLGACEVFEMADATQNWGAPVTIPLDFR